MPPPLRTSGLKSFALTLDSGVTGLAAQINLTDVHLAGVPNTSFAVPIILGSDLTIDTGYRVFNVAASGSLAAGAHHIAITGGYHGLVQTVLAGDLSGSGVLTVNSGGGVLVQGTKSFTGTVVLNRGGAGGSFGGSDGRSRRNRVPRARRGGRDQWLLRLWSAHTGGELGAAKHSTVSTNPGQQLPRSRMTFNGGSLFLGGQAFSGAAQGTLVRNDVATVRLISGYSSLALVADSSSSGTLLNVATLERAAGATAFVRSWTLGNRAAEIWQWRDFPQGRRRPGRLHDDEHHPVDRRFQHGLDRRLLPPFRRAPPTACASTAAETATSLTAGATSNVVVGSFASLPAPVVTVNSLALTGDNHSSTSAPGRGSSWPAEPSRSRPSARSAFPGAPTRGRSSLARTTR